MTHHSDSASITNHSEEEITKITEKLSSKFDIITTGFSKNIEPYEPLNFKGNATNLSATLQNLNQTYHSNQLKGIILYTDGIVNSGEDPLNIINSITTPIYSIGTGDTVSGIDIELLKVRHNSVVNTGTDLSFIAELKWNNIKLNSVALDVTCDGKKIVHNRTSVNSSNRFIAVKLPISAPEPGIHHYVVETDHLNGEKNKSNNRIEFNIEVIRDKKKIALLYHSPHPDLQIFRSILKENPRYEISFINARENPSQLSYDLVIAHQVPSSDGVGNEILKKLSSQSHAVLFVLGSQSGTHLLNEFSQNIFSINNSRNSLNEAVADASQNFGFFNFEQSYIDKINKFPPLLTPFGSYSTGSNVQTLFNQKIGNVVTQYPLIAYGINSNFRAGLFAGEGIWKWFLNDVESEEHASVSDLMNKSVAFLLAHEKESPLKLIMQPVYDAGENVTIMAELKDASGAINTSANTVIKITGPDNKTKLYACNVNGDNYSLDVGVLPSGNYSCIAEATLGNSKYTAIGNFRVSTTKLEWVQQVSDHRMLRELSETSGGAFYLPTDIDKLIDRLLNQKDSNNIIKKKNTNIPLTYFPYILITLLLMLCGEWFIRKWNGSI